MFCTTYTLKTLSNATAISLLNILYVTSLYIASELNNSSSGWPGDTSSRRGSGGSNSGSGDDDEDDDTTEDDDDKPPRDQSNIIYTACRETLLQIADELYKDDNDTIKKIESYIPLDLFDNNDATNTNTTRDIDTIRMRIKDITSFYDR